MLRKKGKVLTPKRKLKVVSSKVYVNKECDDKNYNISKMHWQFLTARKKNILSTSNTLFYLRRLISMTLYYEEVQIKYFLYFAFKVQMSNEKMTGRPGHNSIRKRRKIF